MPAGQRALMASLLDVGELDRIADRIEVRERRRSIEHAEQLADALALHRTLKTAGMALSTGAQLALLMGCSEYRANMMLAEARVLGRLGALEPMRRGLMTVEQARVVADLLGPVDDELAASLWDRLQDRLAADQRQGNVRPPARLRELLQRWLIAADPAGHAERRREEAEDSADVQLWRRDNGLVDLVIRSLSAADAQACADRIEQHAQPDGTDDERPAGVRRRDAARDLLLGRTAPPFDSGTGQVQSGCCPPGAPAPCGANLFVHVPLDTALAESAEPAELVGLGPIDADALRDLLLAAPVLHRVWVDSNGVPVAVDDHTWTPGSDPALLEHTLAQLRTGPPPDGRPLAHPDDHPPGPYVAPRRLKQLLRARAPRCEWPGCGRRSSRAAAAGCDLDHDLAWPYGPTCTCNLGPLCRRHHRIKQLGWTKHRSADGSIRWTSPAGRTWASPNQHEQPARRRRLVAPGVWVLAS